MNSLFYLYRQSWVALLIVIAAGIVSGLSGAALVPAINKGDSVATSLTTLTWIFFSLCILHLIVKAYSEIYLLRLTQTAIVRLRIELSRQPLAAPLKTLQDLGRRRLLVILTKDTQSFTQASLLLPIVFGNIITIGACLGYIAWLLLPLFFPFMVLLFGGLFAYHFAERRPLRQLALLRERMDVIYENFCNLIKGGRELQLNKQRGDSIKVKVVDGKYSTIDLSKGQRNHLALVSSHLEDRQIYLFDEWAADQHPIFKHFFYTGLLPNLKVSGKTVLVITYDDAYFPLVDRIIKLKDGHLKPISLPAGIKPRASPYVI
jgi:ABC-type siderophore export system fused ATPase/permease subunit